MNQEKIGKFIAKLRNEKKLTQTELGEKLGVSYKAVSKWENGKNMPDVSLFKPLCEILEISVNELINGEKEKINAEKTIINIIDSNQKDQRKMHNIIKILLFLIVIILVLTISIIIYYKNKYPKIDIYNLSVIKSDKEELKEFVFDNYKIFFYGIDSLQLSDAHNNYYDLKNALEYNQITITKIKEYLDFQYNNGNLERYILWDGGTKIYKSLKYTVIMCNTIDGNKDLYFGTPNLENDLKGAYCGHEANDTCYFTRTYHIINIAEADDPEFIKVTLKDNKENKTVVTINKGNLIQAGNDYEFVFSTYDNFKDKIENIFERSTLIEIKLTDKTGSDQINDKICVNQK